MRLAICSLTALEVLLREGAVRGGVLGDDRDETVSEGLDGGSQRSEGRAARGVSASDDARVELLEECERDRGDVERALGVPDDESVVELLGDGEGSEVPGVAAVVRVLGVATGGDGSVGGDTAVDGVDGTESVNVDLEVGEGLVGAGLEGGSVTSGGSIESVDRGQDGVGIPTRATSASVCSNVTASGVPVALISGDQRMHTDTHMIETYLQEAEKVGSLGGVAANDRGLADLGGESSTLAQGTVLDGGGEERRRGDLLPQVEARVVGKNKYVSGGCVRPEAQART